MLAHHTLHCKNLENHDIAVFQVLAMQNIMRYASMFVRNCSATDFFGTKT